MVGQTVEVHTYKRFGEPVKFSQKQEVTSRVHTIPNVPTRDKTYVIQANYMFLFICSLVVTTFSQIFQPMMLRLLLLVVCLLLVSLSFVLWILPCIVHLIMIIYYLWDPTAVFVGDHCFVLFCTTPKVTIIMIIIISCDPLAGKLTRWPLPVAQSSPSMPPHTCHWLQGSS